MAYLAHFLYNIQTKTWQALPGMPRLRNTRNSCMLGSNQYIALQGSQIVTVTFHNLETDWQVQWKKMLLQCDNFCDIAFAMQ